MSKYEPGTVMRATHVQYNGDDRDGSIPSEYYPLWAISVGIPEYNEGSGCKVLLLSPHPDRPKPHYNPPRMIWDDSCDEFEIVSPEQWPDDICTAVALYHLTETDE